MLYCDFRVLEQFPFAVFDSAEMSVVLVGLARIGSIHAPLEFDDIAR